MPVDSFKFLPRVLAEFYRLSAPETVPDLPIPWTPLPRPLSECRFALLTSGGFYRPGIDPPFDTDRERQQPDWGDPSFRFLPTTLQPGELDVAHLHLNTADLVADPDILLPVQRMRQLAQAGEIGGLAPTAYSCMGYQGFPPDTSTWEAVYAPQVVAQLKQEAVDCVLLTPA